MDHTESPPEFDQESVEPISKDPIANIRNLIKKRVPRLRIPKIRSPKVAETRPSFNLWRFTAFVSLVVNFLFIVLIVVIGARLMQFKSAVMEPLLEGVYSAIGQMDNASFDSEITVQSEIPVAFDLPLQRETVVTLSQPTRIENAYLSIRSATFSVDAPSTIDLPIGAQLPITLDITVPVHTTVPVELAVPVKLSLADSDLQPAVDALQDLVEPYKELSKELPDCWQMLLWGGECP